MSVATTTSRPIHDPAIARLIYRDNFAKANKEHRCDGDGTWRPQHQILPGEVYAKSVMVDDEHRTFRTYRVCGWCQYGESRPAGWLP